MSDLLFLVVVGFCFAGAAWFVRVCAWVVGRVDRPSEDAPGVREPGLTHGSPDAEVDR